MSEFKIELAFVLVEWIPLMRYWLHTFEPVKIVTAARKNNSFAIPELECRRVFICLLLLVSSLIYICTLLVISVIVKNNVNCFTKNVFLAWIFQRVAHPRDTFLKIEVCGRSTW